MMNTKEKDYETNFQTEYPTFSERLNYAMQIRSFTNQKLGDCLFITASAVSGYRTGKRSPNPEVLARICRELSVSADYLLGLSDQIDLIPYQVTQKGCE